MTPQGRAMLMEDEGRRTEAYPDPDSGGDPWTIGVGHTGPEVHEGLVWPDAKIEAVFDADIVTAETELAHALPWTANLDPARLDVLENMTFNMGPSRLLGFHHMLAALRVGDWKTAAAEMLNSAWTHQVKGRAYRLASIMQSGVYPT